MVAVPCYKVPRPSGKFSAGLEAHLSLRRIDISYSAIDIARVHTRQLFVGLYAYKTFQRCNKVLQLKGLMIAQVEQAMWQFDI